MSKPKPIPDRWLNYRPIGERIHGTRFIAFKVPLSEYVNEDVEEACRLAPSSLLQSVNNLGIIIDLTNTNRYYNRQVFIEQNVEHQKLMIPGHRTPQRWMSEKFCEHVSEFLEANSDNDKLIGVHCTHGVNRTGYLICYFMITKLNMSPELAMEAFAAARGHPIERQNYTQSLSNINTAQEFPHIHQDAARNAEQNRPHMRSENYGMQKSAKYYQYKAAAYNNERSGERANETYINWQQNQERYRGANETAERISSCRIHSKDRQAQHQAQFQGQKQHSYKERRHQTSQERPHGNHNQASYNDWRHQTPQDRPHGNHNQASYNERRHQSSQERPHRSQTKNQDAHKESRQQTSHEQPHRSQNKYIDPHKEIRQQTSPEQSHRSQNKNKDAYRESMLQTQTSEERPRGNRESRKAISLSSKHSQRNIGPYICSARSIRNAQKFKQSLLSRNFSSSVPSSMDHSTNLFERPPNRPHSPYH
ncbi:CG13197 [Drosophila busckii]|uniref:CG13197 n=1 Tax=Drosophila busckii TaxID=30019 RepID=A0A0M4EF20_DROBS|nr:uncharacterized protein LOC108595411 [Drosophila busckii]ALC40710.1 CG13197 [Drosophila busckii]